MLAYLQKIVSCSDLSLGSTVLIHLSDTTIIAAADSRERNPRTNAINERNKIIQEGDKFFAAAGLYTYDKTNYDIFLLVQEKMRLTSALSTIQDSIKLEISKQVRNICLMEPAQLRLIVGNKAEYSIIETALFGFEDSLPKVKISNYWIDSTPQLIRVDQRIYAPGTILLPQVLMLGHYEIARAHIIAALSQSRRDNVQILDEAIDKQAIATPNDVGGPVDIVEIKSTGCNWIRRK